MSVSIALTFAVWLACAGAAPTSEEIPSPAGARSGVPNLVRGDDGKVYLSWIERGQKLSTLRFSVWEGAAWSKPRDIASGPDWFVNWADFPSLAVLADGTLAAQWLAKNGTGAYSYGVRISISRDGGGTWAAPITPHRDGTPTEHGFVSMVPMKESRFGLVWLDGRNMADESHGESHGESSGESHGESSGESSGFMTLRFNTLTASGQLGTEIVLDERVCECCQTSAVALADGSVVVVYRDRSADEVRDIGVIRVLAGKASAPRVIHADGWKIEGCPVNGPAIAAREQTLAAAWFTQGSEEQSRVLVAWSVNGGQSFGKPTVVDDGDPLGRVDVLLLDPETALVSWLEQRGEEAEIRLRYVNRNGGPARPSLVVSPTRSSRASGFPRMERLDPGVILAWTNAGDPARVHTARITATRDAEKNDPGQ